MIGSATISLFMLALVSIKYNISLHAAGSAGLFGFLLAITLRLGLFSPLSLYGSLFLAGIAGTARLKQNAHKPAEVYAGYITGFLMCFVFNYYYRIQ
jgi:membrane-associated phospholipid phosphatase